MISEDEHAAVTIRWPDQPSVTIPLASILEALEQTGATTGLFENGHPSLPAGRIAATTRAITAGHAFGAAVARDLVKAPASGLLLRLRSTSMQQLPWELLRDPASGLPLAREDGVIRVPADAAADWSVQPNEELRLLLVVARPSGARDVPLRAVIGPLLHLFSRVTVDVLRPATATALRETLVCARQHGTPYTAVHVDCHGGVDESGAYIVLENERGGATRVRSPALAGAVADSGVKLTTLNACRSAASGNDLASDLTEHGVPVAVAMRSAVGVDTAREFFVAFYQRLLAGDPVAVAVAAGRRELHRFAEYEDSGIKALDWLVPVHHARHEVRFHPSPFGPDAPEAAPLLGRDDAIHALDRALRDHRIVLVHGPLGIGKTALAEELAQWWQRTRVGGVTYVSGLQDHHPPAGEAFCWIWDGFEKVRDNTAARDRVLAMTDAHPDGRLVLFSRGQEEWLGPNVARVPLDDLDLRSAAVLAERTYGQPVRRGSAVEALLRWIGGHPQVLSTVMPAARDSDPMTLLAALRHGGEHRMGPAFDAMTLALADALDQLDVAARESLSVLCTMPRSIDVDLLVRLSAEPGMPARIAHRDRSGWIDVLEAAADQGLVARPDDSTYRMHPALSAVLADRWLAESPDHGSQERDAVLLAQSRQAGRSAPELQAMVDGPAFVDDPLLLGQFGRRIRNVRRLLLWSPSERELRPLGKVLSREEWDAAWELTAQSGPYGFGAITIAWSVFVDDHWPEDPRRLRSAVRVCRAILRNVERSHPTLLNLQRTVDAHRQLATVAYRNGSLWLAEQSCLLGLSLAAESKIWTARTEAHERYVGDLLDGRDAAAVQMAPLELLYAHVMRETDRLTDARTHAEQAVDLYDSLGDRLGQAQAHEVLADLAEIERRPEDERTHVVASLECHEQAGNSPGVAGAYLRLGRAALGDGRQPDAQDWLLRARRLADEIGDDYLAGDAAAELGKLALRQEQTEAALGWFGRAEAAYQRWTESTGGQADNEIAGLYGHIGAALLGTNDLHRARYWFNAALGRFRGRSASVGIMAAYEGLAIVAAAEGDLRAFRRWSRKAERRLRISGERFARFSEHHDKISAIMRQEEGKQ